MSWTYSWKTIGLQEAISQIDPDWLQFSRRQIQDAVINMLRRSVPVRARNMVAATAPSSKKVMPTAPQDTNDLLAAIQGCEAFLQSEVDALENDPKRLQYIPRSKAEPCPVCLREYNLSY